MSDDRYKSEEQRAKEEAYREYLRLREESGRGGQKGGVQGSSRNGLGSPERRSPSVTGTPYGSSELRRRAKEKEADRQAYLKARAETEEEERTYRESRAAKKAAKAARKASRKEDSPYSRTAKKKNRKLRIALIVLIVLILGVGGVAAGALGMAMNTLNKIGHVKIHKDEIAISSEAKSNLKDFTNIAVLGVDARDVENDKDSRSDVIIASKVGAGRPGVPNGNGLGRKHVLKSLEASLKRLGTDYLDIFYCHAPDHITPAEEIISDPRMQSFKAMMHFISDNYQRQIKLDDIAQSGNVSKSLCNTLFHQYVSESPINYLMHLRCRKVAELLRSGNMPMSQIAALTGFGGVSYMSETFRKFFEKSPREYRKQWE